MIKSLTPKHCQSLCDMLGFLYSGVQDEYVDWKPILGIVPISVNGR